MVIFGLDENLIGYLQTHADKQKRGFYEFPKGRVGSGRVEALDLITRSSLQYHSRFQRVVRCISSSFFAIIYPIKGTPMHDKFLEKS